MVGYCHNVMFHSYPGFTDSPAGSRRVRKGAEEGGLHEGEIWGSSEEGGENTVVRERGV